MFELIVLDFMKYYLQNTFLNVTAHKMTNQETEKRKLK